MVDRLLQTLCPALRALALSRPRPETRPPWQVLVEKARHRTSVLGRAEGRPARTAANLGIELFKLIKRHLQIGIAAREISDDGCVAAIVTPDFFDASLDGHRLVEAAQPEILHPERLVVARRYQSSQAATVADDHGAAAAEGFERSARAGKAGVTDEMVRTPVLNNGFLA